MLAPFKTSRPDLQAAARVNGEALIDPQALVLIRWIALFGQSAALFLVFFFLWIDRINKGLSKKCPDHCAMQIIK